LRPRRRPAGVEVEDAVRTATAPPIHRRGGCVGSAVHRCRAPQVTATSEHHHELVEEVPDSRNSSHHRSVASTSSRQRRAGTHAYAHSCGRRCGGWGLAEGGLRGGRATPASSGAGSGRRRVNPRRLGLLSSTCAGCRGGAGGESLENIRGRSSGTSRRRGWPVAGQATEATN
jgi:hypothetical protein